MKNVFASLTALAIIVTAMGVGTANAAVIFTEDFESPNATGSENPRLTPDGWEWTVRGREDISGLNVSDGDQFLHGYHGGGNFAIQTTSTILSDTVISGSTYTLSFKAWEASRGLHFEARLLAIDDDNGGAVTELASDSFESDGVHTSKAGAYDFTLETTPTSYAGQRLAIDINGSPYSSSHHSAFDDVELTSSVIPEPASLALLALGGLLIAGRRRRRN